MLSIVEVEIIGDGSFDDASNRRRHFRRGQRNNVVERCVQDETSDVGVVHSTPRGRVGADGPRVDDDVFRIEFEFVDGKLHHDIDGVLLLRRERDTLQSRKSIYVKNREKTNFKNFAVYRKV